MTVELAGETRINEDEELRKKEFDWIIKFWSRKDWLVTVVNERGLFLESKRLSFLRANDKEQDIRELSEEGSAYSDGNSEREREGWIYRE